jgi:hypothetical protein
VDKRGKDARNLLKVVKHLFLVRGEEEGIRMALLHSSVFQTRSSWKL